MDFHSNQSILQFHCCGTISQDAKLNRQKKHHFKHLCSWYNKPKQIIINKK